MHNLHHVRSTILGLTQMWCWSSKCHQKIIYHVKHAAINSTSNSTL